jgi:SulP family sulfate permease
MSARPGKPTRRLPLDRVPFLPDWILTYKVRYLGNDLLAGLTVAIMLIPQGMAYALLAGMPPIYGLYASLVPLIVYAFIGSSRHLSVGTTAIDSLFMAFALSAWADPGSDAYIGYALMFAVMVGLVHVALSVGRLGFLVNLLSRPVILGFISAAAAIIGFNQLAGLMGVPLPRAEHVYTLIYEAALHVSDTHLPSLGLGLAGILLLVLFRKWNRLFPAAIVVVTLAILVTWWLDLDGRGVAIVGFIPTGLPSFEAPAFDQGIARELMLPAIMLALLQFTNVVSLGKAFAARYDYSIYPNRELFALGMANIMGAFFQGITVSGSFSRTAVNADAGARSPLANLVAALLVGLTLLVLTPLLYFLPVPMLADIIMVAAFGMINLNGLRHLYKMKRADGHLALMTFIVTLLFGLQTGILIGMTASVIAIMYRISRPNVAILGNLPGTRSYRDVEVFDEAKLIAGILILRVDASFSYANADYLKEFILHICDLEKNTDIHSVIIDASSVNDLDTTAVEALYSVVDRLDERGIGLYVTGIHGSVRGVFDRSGLDKRLGTDHFFLSPHRAVQHIHKTRNVPWYDDTQLNEDASLNQPYN